MEDANPAQKRSAAALNSGPQTSSSTDRAAQPGVLEKRRLKELFKYFLSIWQSAGPVNSSDIDAQAGYDPDSAKLSADPVLNGLAQLATHRLSAERAFISLIDDEHQYVIAEATRHISLFDSKHHPPYNGLCIGARPLDLKAGVCAGTMPAFLDTTSVGPYKDTPNIYADRYRYVINDFAAEDDYRDRPYVTGFPFMRYYAEVPIKSPSGEVIGTLAVVDNEPRVGLSDEDWLAMCEVSKSIMFYLQKVKTDLEHVQASKLLWGLNSFLQSDGITSSEPMGRLKDPPGLESQHIKPVQENDELQQVHFVARKRQKSDAFSSSESRSPTSDPSTISERATNHIDTRVTGPDLQPSESVEVGPPPRRKAPAGHKTSNECRTDSESADANGSAEIRNSFSNAADILRRAMDLDGVVFLDASLTEFASRTDLDGAAETNNLAYSDPQLISGGVDRERASPNGPGMRYKPSSKDLGPEGRPRMSGRLGYSIPDARTETRSTTTSTSFSLPEVVHQSLLYHYPKGHVFDFNQRQELLENEPSSGYAGDYRDAGGVRSNQRIMSRRDINMAVRHAFPDVRSAVFAPLWSSEKQSWFAGGLGWTKKNRRMLQRDDLVYLAVFGNSIMAEVTRLDLLASDRAKSDFISSISHELRSPLHGIMGTAELLKEATKDDALARMIEMIEICGHTLLDTVDHILDYAKIKTIVPNVREHNMSVGRKRQNSLTTQQVADFDIAEELEETVESMIAGHRYNKTIARRIEEQDQLESYSSLVQRGQPTPPNDVIVVINVEQRPSWRVETDLAAWRRILLNLVGNSLKYTDTGVVEVTLQAGQELVSLTVRDTGRGISKSFLQDHLFTPFVQENSLSAGTGLGLSIVQKIVQGLNGTLNVRSEVGVGTQVDVVLPLSIAPAMPMDITARPVRAKAALVGFDSSPDLNFTPTGILPAASKAAIALRGAVENYAKNWAGLTVTSSSDPKSAGADLIAISDDSLHLLQIEDGKGAKCLSLPGGSSLLVVSKFQAVGRLQQAAQTDRVQYVAQPFGPRRMKQAIEAALRAQRSETMQIPLTPASQSDAEPIPMEQSNHQPAEPSGADARPASSTKVLLVDDNPINLQMLVSFARKISCTYATAVDGRGALESYVRVNGQHASGDREPFDYVLMDINMPVMDGFASARAIREYEFANGLKKTPIVALTGLGSLDAQNKAFTSGIDIFLTKPVSLAQIRVLVEQGLEAFR